MPSPKPDGSIQAHDERARRFGLLLVILVALTIVRLVGLKLSVVDLFYDESQYWSWARDPALGYFSKPPLLAWLLIGVHYGCGDTEWCTRSLSPVIHTCTCIIVYLIGRQLYDDRVGFWASVLAAFTTGVVFSSRIISTDVPLLLFWTIALLAYVKLLQRSDKMWALVLGLSLGLGLLSKYAMIYFIPGMLLTALVDRRARALLQESVIWLGLLVALIVISPNIIWNMMNSFTTFKHTGGLVLGEPFNPSALRGLEFLASQFAVFGPVVFSVMILATFRFGTNALAWQDRLLVAFFLTPIVVVTIFGVFAKAYANWASPSIVSGIILCAAVLLRGYQAWLWSSVALGAFLQMLLISTDAIATRLPARIGVIRNPYSRVLGWRDYAQRAGRLSTTLGAQTIATDSRRSFDTLRYYWRDQPQSVLSWQKAGELPYDFSHPLTPVALDPILFVTACPDASRLKKYYAHVEPLGLIADNPSGSRLFFAFKLRSPGSGIGLLDDCKTMNRDDQHG